ncbi:hypothetical protein ERO13_D06G130500v2 [Gossypium hirsutum]|nr:hypothetical protein ERO13_D06G130500v2 [Gossypium hirsutum]
MIKHHPYFHHIKSSVFGFMFLLPTSLFALSLLLLACNGFSVFYMYLPGYIKSSPEPIKLLPENLSGDKTVTKLVSSVMYAVKEENPPGVLKTHLSLVKKPNFSMVPIGKASVFKPKQARLSRQILRTLGSGTKPKGFFSSKVKTFFRNSKCKSRFFMTWISPIESLSDRELLAIESVFKSHPKACLVIVSNSLDSKKGSVVLKPFSDMGFKLIAVHPDFDYIFKNTYAETWFNRLKNGNINPGEVSLGQNLSNLLRLALLYKYGGVYLDTDVLVLKSINRLRNVISAQSINPETKNWSRLNNAVLILIKTIHCCSNSFKNLHSLSMETDGVTMDLTWFREWLRGSLAARGLTSRCCHRRRFIRSIGPGFEACFRGLKTRLTRIG